MNLGELYDAYGAMEQLPVDARAADAAAAKRRSELLVVTDERAARAKQEAEAAKATLQSDLRAEAQAASAIGAIPKSGAVRSGAEPNFGRVRSARGRLEGLLSEQKNAATDLARLEAELAALEKQIEDELQDKGAWAEAQAADVVTYSLGGLAAALSLVCGPGPVGVCLLIAGLAMVAYRFVNGRSARMLRAAEKRPAIGSHPKVRLGYVLTGVGWWGGGLLVLNLVATAVLNVSGISPAVGSLSRQGLDLAWFGGLLLVACVIVAGYRSQRSAR